MLVHRILHVLDSTCDSIQAFLEVLAICCQCDGAIEVLHEANQVIDGGLV